MPRGGKRTGTPGQQYGMAGAQLAAQGQMNERRCDWCQRPWEELRPGCTPYERENNLDIRLAVWMNASICADCFQADIAKNRASDA